MKLRGLLKLQQEQQKDCEVIRKLGNVSKFV